MKLLKRGIGILAVLGLFVACTSDDGEMNSGVLTDVDFTVSISGDGTVATVTPTSSGATMFEIDFGSDATDDVQQTVGVPLTYNYEDETATYTIKVTAQAEGKESVSVAKEQLITYQIPQTDVVGRWVMLHDAGAMAIGPSVTDFSWWSNGLPDVKTRSCFFDDVFEFKSDGTFVNELGSETWMETWTGVDTEGCASPLAPFDGTASATWFHNEEEETITLTGKGAFLGLIKAINGAEISSLDQAATSLTYTSVSFSDDKNIMTVQISIGSGVWQFKLAKEGSVGASLPDVDSDGDGVLDVDDECPNLHGGDNENGCPDTGIGEDPNDDFEGTGNITWEGDAAGANTGVANPSKTGINTSDNVLQYVDEGGQYANIRFDLNADKTDKFDLSTKNVFKVKVYVPSPGTAHVESNNIVLKLQDGSSASPWEGQVVVEHTYEYDTWQELTFDFSAYSAETKFSRVVVQFNGENNYEWVTAYLDDFTYGANE
ncbi:hypothetical protein Q4595_04185 [Wenyingzhuangia sp. 1_MG-2023]|nr:hypothetical protein [Wenyingzhuangia sp. 1_MG-2023]